MKSRGERLLNLYFLNLHRNKLYIESFSSIFMQSKAILLLGAFLSLFLLSFTSALYVCDDSQTILKMSSVSNAHVEFYNQSLYSLRLCYGDIYGVNYTLPSQHSCTGTNIVAKLAQATNSHIEGPLGVSFNNNVCYGDLQCVLRNTNCIGTENLILTLSQSTNAHADFNNILPFRLCCSSAFAIANTNATNTTNTTNPFNNVFGFTINAPINGSTYNDFMPISINVGTANSVNYSIDSGTTVNYTSPTSISLVAGSHFVTIMASNNTGFGQQTIYFTILNTTSGSGSGSSGSGNGGNSNKGVKTGTTIVKQENNDFNAEEGTNEPLYLESESKSRLSSLTALQLVGSIVFFLIILILLAILLVHRRNQAKRVR